MSLKTKVAFNTLVQIVGKFATAGSTFLITILIARSYGVSGFGEFTKMTSYVALFYLISDFGFNAVYLKEEKEKKLSFVNLISLRGVWAMILAFLSLAILIFLPSNSADSTGFTPLSKLGIVVLAPTILTQAIFTSFNALFQKNLRYDRSVLAAIGGSLVTLLAFYIFSQANLSLSITVSAYVIGGSALIFFSYILAKKFLGKSLKISEEFLLQNLSTWKIIFKKSLPLGLTLVFNLLYFRSDIFVLTFFRSTQEVGIYGLAYKVFEFPLAIPTFFINAVYPIMLSSKLKEATKQTSRIIKTSAVFLLIVSLVIAICGLILAPYISLIKQDFIPSIVPFRILIASLPFFFLSSLLMWALIAEGKQSVLLKIYGLGMIVNLALNLIFIPSYGYNAAAIITLASEGLILFLLFDRYKNISRQ